MAIEETKYVSFAETVYIHFHLMKRLGETRYGVDHRSLIESALARPQHARDFENADLIRQASALYFGLIKNHPWLVGNKRTATAIVDEFLFRNNLDIRCSKSEIIELVLNIESNSFQVDEIEEWLREKTFPLK